MVGGTMSKAKKGRSPRERKNLPLKTVTIVLTEAGYRCAVPTCRGILALDIHHIWEVVAGGGDEPFNLIALCPYCHALYHRGTISADSIYAYKAMLVAISRAFDLEAVDRLLFLNMCPDYLLLSGDGLLHFARLIAAGLATFRRHKSNEFYHRVAISERGRLLIETWQRGDRARLAHILGGPVAG
jgi:hypothetical protein